MECGIVFSENTLVSEVSFGETSGGAAMAHGTLISDESSKLSPAEPRFFHYIVLTTSQRMLVVVAIIDMEGARFPVSKCLTTVCYLSFDAEGKFEVTKLLLWSFRSTKNTTGGEYAFHSGHRSSFRL